MADLNTLVKETMQKRLSVYRELVELSKIYSRMFSEIQDKFRSEVHGQKGDMKGLEDFYALFMRTKKDFMSIKSALLCIKRTEDISNFDIAEDVELEKIFEDPK